MKCSSPMEVGFKADGKTITWSKKNASKEFASMKLPCGKCIECRLEYARQWAVRCVHEAQMYSTNSFVTLTYAPEKLQSEKLVYSDFQKFMKRLRKTQKDPIGVFATGEYGGINKRPHFHAIIFNWEPKDAVYKYTSPRGDRVFESKTLDKLWGHGIAEFGSVTFESAGYCARYSAKKLVHGKDEDHVYQPISRKSSKHAIGKRWLEQYWPDVFYYGRIILSDGSSCSIPRYYERWFRQYHPDGYKSYIIGRKSEITYAAAQAAEVEYLRYVRAVTKRPYYAPGMLTPLQREHKINLIKFKKLQDNLKL